MKLYGNKEFEIRREVTLPTISDHRRGYLLHLPTTNCRRLHPATPDSDSLPLSVYLSLPLSVYLSIPLSIPFLYPFPYPFLYPFYTPFYTLSIPQRLPIPTHQNIQTIHDNYEIFIVTMKLIFHQNRPKPSPYLCS